MFEVGQEVWDVVRGRGVVVRIENDFGYPVAVDLDCERRVTYTSEGKYAEYDENISLYPYRVEVVKKVAKPSINWAHVRGEYKFLAQDSTGVAWLYSEEPTLYEGFLDAELGDFALADSHASYTPGTCDWKDSLVARPKDA